MGSTTQELAHDRWRPYFDELSRNLGTVEATVEVAGQDIGDQIAAERLLLRGITYDDRDDIDVIALEALGEAGTLEHMVEHPQRIFIATGEGAELTVDVEDADGHRTLVTLDRPPALPAPG